MVPQSEKWLKIKVLKGKKRNMRKKYALRTVKIKNTNLPLLWIVLYKIRNLILYFYLFL